MSRQFDIFKLAEDVLASVAEPSSEKVASESDVAVAAKTEIGALLKTAAAALREAPEDVTYEDLHATLSAATKYAAAGMSMSSSSAPASNTIANTAAGAKLPDMSVMQQGAPGPAPNNPTGQQKFASDNSSAVGVELRNLASILRNKSAAEQTVRATKAAHIITAAVGIEHLTRTLTN